MKEKEFYHWLNHSQQGQYIWQIQAAFWQKLLQNSPESSHIASWGFPKMSDMTKIALFFGGEGARAQVICQPWAIPLPNHSIDLLLMPHGLEFGEQSQWVIQECERVLAPYGKVAFTGFNPHSLWRLSQTWYKLSLTKRTMALPQLKTLCTHTSLTQDSGQFMGYALPYRPQFSPQSFLELAGNRWWPHAAALYGIVLRKESCCLTPLAATRTSHHHWHQLVPSASGATPSPSASKASEPLFSGNPDCTALGN